MGNAPKKPQDHQQPKPRVRAVENGHEVTVDGLTVTVLADALDDFELLDELNDLDRGNPTRLPSLLRRIISADDYTKAMDHLRTAGGGRVRIEPAADLIKALFGAVNPES